jgi:hypothetical protein
MRYLHFCVQVLTVFGCIVFAILTFLGFEAITWFIIFQLAVLISLYTRLYFLWKTNRRNSRIQSHLVLSSAYIMLLGAFHVFADNNSFQDELYGLVVMAPSWVLTGFDFILSFKKTFRQRETGNFLRHISF